VGSGTAGIDGLNASDVITSGQMPALFGPGCWPSPRRRQLEWRLSERDYQAVTRLGAPFKIYHPDVSPFRVEVARRIAAPNHVAGIPGDSELQAARARIRNQVGREYFTDQHAGTKRRVATVFAGVDPQTRPARSRSSTTSADFPQRRSA
jgi:hypothetical protein